MCFFSLVFLGEIICIEIWCEGEGCVVYCVIVVECDIVVLGNGLVEFL